jgi:hypothetical protein
MFVKLYVRDLSVTGKKLFVTSRSSLAQALTPPTCMPKSPVRMPQPNRPSLKFSCSSPLPPNMAVLYLELGCDRFLPSPYQFILTNDALQASQLTLLARATEQHGRVSLRNWHSGNYCALWNRKVHHHVHTSPLLVLLWARSIQFTLSSPVALTFTLLSFFHLCQVFQVLFSFSAHHRIPVWIYFFEYFLHEYSISHLIMWSHEKYFLRFIN